MEIGFKNIFNESWFIKEKSDSYDFWLSNLKYWTNVRY
jgi:hypothetical protein